MLRFLIVTLFALFVSCVCASAYTGPTDDEKWAVVELSVDLLCNDPDPALDEKCQRLTNVWKVLHAFYKTELLAKWRAAVLYVTPDEDPWFPNPLVAKTLLNSLNSSPAHLPSLRTYFFGWETKRDSMIQIVRLYCFNATDDINCVTWEKKTTEGTHGCYVDSPIPWPTSTELKLWELHVAPGTSTNDPWHRELIRPEWVKTFLALPQIQAQLVK